MMGGRLIPSALRVGWTMVSCVRGIRVCFGCGEIDHRNLDCPHGRYKSKGGDDDQEAQGGDEAPDVAAG